LVVVFFDLVQFTVEGTALYRYRIENPRFLKSTVAVINLFILGLNGLFLLPFCIVTLEEAFGDLDKKTNSKIKLVVDKASLEDELGNFPQL
jgi:hypothetical protein